MAKIDIHLQSFGKRIKGKFPKIFSDAFLQDSTVRVLAILSGILILIGWVIVLVRFQPSEYVIPIRYNGFFGVTQLGNWYELYSIPLVASFCGFLNLLLGDVTYKKDKMVGYIFVAANMFVAVMMLIVVINFSYIIGM